jgi:hypothetical protein
MNQFDREARERARLLLIDRALFGLAPAQADELRRLLERHPELDDGSWERTAAALALALLE